MSAPDRDVVDDDQEGVDDQPEPEETEQQRREQPDRSLLFRSVLWLRRNAPTLIGVTLIGGLLLTSVLDVEIPRWLRLGGLVYGLVLFAIGRPTSKKARELLWQPRMIYAVDVSAEDDDGGIFKEPLAKFQDWDVERRGDWRSPNLVFFESVNYEEKTARGTWTGTLSGAQLMQGLGVVFELRDDLDDKARRGEALESNLWMIVRDAAQAAVRTVNETFKKGSLPDEGSSITAAVEDTMARWGVKRATVDDLEDEAPANEVPAIELQVPDVDDLSTAGRETGGDDE